MSAATTALALAHHVHSIGASTLSAPTREAALRCVLDLTCAAAAGFDEPGVQAVRSSVLDLFGRGDSDIWFSGGSANVCGAMLANSAAAAALDLDDGYRQARGHPGATAIPAAWAMLDVLPASVHGAERFLAAIAAGYEAGVRMSMGRLSYAPTGAWSPYVTIAAAGSLCSSGPEVMAQAFGIAAQTAPSLPGLAGLMGSDVKEGIPWGSVTGLAALRLAQAGATGPAQIFDEPSLFHAGRILEGCDAEPLIAGTYFKPFACCRHIHAPLEAYVALSELHSFVAADVEQIEVHTYRATFHLSNSPEPQTLVEAQYSVPYSVALCAVLGPNALMPMDVARLQDTAVRALARRVLVHHDPEIEPLFPARAPARVTVTLRNGARLSSAVTDPRGDPATPLSWRELETKFMTATARALRPLHQHAVLDAMAHLRSGNLEPLRLAMKTGGSSAFS